MPFNQVQEGQENRGNNLPDSRIYPASITGQKIESSVETIVMPLSGWQVRQGCYTNSKSIAHLCRAGYTRRIKLSGKARPAIILLLKWKLNQTTSGP